MFCLCEQNSRKLLKKAYFGSFWQRGRPQNRFSKKIISMLALLDISTLAMMHLSIFSMEL